MGVEAKKLVCRHDIFELNQKLKSFSQRWSTTFLIYIHSQSACDWELAHIKAASVRQRTEIPQMVRA